MLYVEHCVIHIGYYLLYILLYSFAIFSFLFEFLYAKIYSHFNSFISKEILSCFTDNHWQYPISSPLLFKIKLPSSFFHFIGIFLLSPTPSRESPSFSPRLMHRSSSSRIVRIETDGARRNSALSLLPLISRIAGAENYARIPHHHRSRLRGALFPSAPRYVLRDSFFRLCEHARYMYIMKSMARKSGCSVDIRFLFFWEARFDWCGYWGLLNGLWLGIFIRVKAFPQIFTRSKENFDVRKFQVVTFLYFCKR